MKRKLLSAFLFAAAGLMPVAAEDKAVIIISADGTQRQEAIKDVDRMELGNEGLTLKLTNGQTDNFDYGSIDRILVNEDRTAVEKLTANGEIAIWPSQTTGPVSISGLAEGETIRVTNLKGSQIVSTKAWASVTTLNLSALPAGVYIISASNHSAKIIKK